MDSTNRDAGCAPYKRYKRVLAIVIDSIGVGGAPDADKYNSAGADTLGHMANWLSAQQGRPLALPNMERLGLGLVRPGEPFTGIDTVANPAGAYGAHAGHQLWQRFPGRSLGDDVPAGALPCGLLPPGLPR